MFKRNDSESPAEPLRFRFNQLDIEARQGDSIASALLANGMSHWSKTAAGDSDIGPWCMMGACYGCLVSIDGVAVRSCMTIVSEGMKVSSVAHAYDD